MCKNVLWLLWILQDLLHLCLLYLPMIKTKVLPKFQPGEEDVN